MFHVPTKKLGAYVSRVTGDDGKTLRIQVHNIHVLAIHSISSGNGYIFRIGLPKSTYAAEQIIQLDEKALDTVKVQNAQWFANSLPKETIDEYFRPAWDREQMSVLVTTPKRILWGNEIVDNVESLIQRSPDVYRYYASVSLEAQGIYFYPKKFGIRWMLKEIAFHEQHTDASSESFMEWVHREEVEDFWAGEVAHTIQDLNGDIFKLKKQIAEKELLQEQLQERLKEAQQEKEVSPDWHENLEWIKDRVMEYRRRL